MPDGTGRKGTTEAAQKPDLVLVNLSRERRKGKTDCGTSSRLPDRGSNLVHNSAQVKKGKTMADEVGNPTPELNPDGTAATPEAQPEPAKKQRIVLADDAAIAKYGEGKENQSVNAKVAPELYAASVRWAVNNNDGEGKPYKLVADGKIQLRDGTMGDLARRGLAQLVGYTGTLVLVKTTTSAVNEQAATLVRGAAKSIFIMSCRMVLGMGMDEGQSKEDAYQLVNENLANLVKSNNIEVTPAMLDSIWTETMAEQKAKLGQ